MLGISLNSGYRQFGCFTGYYLYRILNIQITSSLSNVVYFKDNYTVEEDLFYNVGV